MASFRLALSGVITVPTVSTQMNNDNKERNAYCRKFLQATKDMMILSFIIFLVATSTGEVRAKEGRKEKELFHPQVSSYMVAMVALLGIYQV